MTNFKHLRFPWSLIKLRDTIGIKGLNRFPAKQINTFVQSNRSGHYCSAKMDRTRNQDRWEFFVIFKIETTKPEFNLLIADKSKLPLILQSFVYCFQLVFWQDIHFLFRVLNEFYMYLCYIIILLYYLPLIMYDVLQGRSIS